MHVYILMYFYYYYVFVCGTVSASASASASLHLVQAHPLRKDDTRKSSSVPNLSGLAAL